MRPTPRLYNTLFSMLEQLPWADKRHLMSCVWMVIGLLTTAKINLSDWVPTVISRALLAQSTERRFRRFLSNDKIRFNQIYNALIPDFFKAWGNAPVYLALDTSMIWNEFCLIRLVVIYRGRAVPLTWRVIEHASSSVSLAYYQDLLEEAKQQIPAGCDVIFLADRGFADTALMAFLSDTLKWKWHIRFKGNISVFQQTKSGYKALRMRAYRGEGRFYHNCYVTRQHYGVIHFAFARPKGRRETWIIASSEPTSSATFEEYGLRFDIEENFLDDKSNGFQLESTGIRHAESLERLCLILAIATIFLVSQGTSVVSSGKRRWVDPHWKRGISYFKIGWRWVKSALARGWRISQSWALSGMPDPEPVDPRDLSELLDRFQRDSQLID